MYGFEINREDSLSFMKQLQNQIRTAILEGKLKAGEKLPPSRSMARELGVSRNTVIQVYEQLIAEGYLTSIEGSGTYVVAVGTLIKTVASERSVQIHKKINKNNMISFTAGDPDSSLFPTARWALAVRGASMDQTSHSYPDEDYAGTIKLRKEISEYVYRVKGIACYYQQIVITAGTAGAIELIAKAFKKNNSKIVIEDPCIEFIKNIFDCYDYEIQPVYVDEQGLVVEQLEMIKETDLMYVVPSHQFPLGGVLPAARRIALLRYANEHNAYVIEDDYDCEFRYNGEPLQPLRNLDPERVIYCGSFSKIFSPTLRIGYMILPHHLLDRVNELMTASNQWVNITIQLALAELLEQKYLDKHVYKMKKAYERKRMHLMKCINTVFGNHAKVLGENAGLHLLLCYERELTKQDVEAITMSGVEVDFVEDYSMVKGRHKNELVLGYGNLSFEEIEEGVKRLKRAICDRFAE